MASPDKTPLHLLERGSRAWCDRIEAEVVRLRQFVEQAQYSPDRSIAKLAKAVLRG